jgi:hypothetical protein
VLPKFRGKSGSGLIGGVGFGVGVFVGGMGVEVCMAVGEGVNVGDKVGVLEGII